MLGAREEGAAAAAGLFLRARTSPRSACATVQGAPPKPPPDMELVYGAAARSMQHAPNKDTTDQADPRTSSMLE